MRSIQTWPPSPACFSDHFPRVRCARYVDEDTGETTPIYLHSPEDVNASVAFWGYDEIARAKRHARLERSIGRFCSKTWLILSPSRERISLRDFRDRAVFLPDWKSADLSRWDGPNSEVGDRGS
jgi:hypothetical protein